MMRLLAISAHLLCLLGSPSAGTETLHAELTKQKGRGFGLKLAAHKSGFVVISGVVQDSPAARVGIFSTDDVLTSVAGTSALGLPLKNVLNLIRAGGATVAFGAARAADADGYCEGGQSCAAITAEDVVAAYLTEKETDSPFSLQTQLSNCNVLVRKGALQKDQLAAFRCQMAACGQDQLQQTPGRTLLSPVHFLSQPRITTCHLMAGLGNQLFQAAATLAHALRNGKAITLSNPCAKVYVKHVLNKLSLTIDLSSRAGHQPVFPLCADQALERKGSYSTTVLHKLRRVPSAMLEWLPTFAEESFAFRPLPNRRFIKLYG
jgi:hypothetical protein